MHTPPPLHDLGGCDGSALFAGRAAHDRSVDQGHNLIPLTLHTHTHKDTLTHTQTHSHTHKHTHTHTNTRIISGGPHHQPPEALGGKTVGSEGREYFIVPIRDT